MKARNYVKELKQLHKEADECMRQISIIGETQNQLSAENIIARAKIQRVVSIIDDEKVVEQTESFMNGLFGEE